MEEMNLMRFILRVRERKNFFFFLSERRRTDEKGGGKNLEKGREREIRKEKVSILHCGCRRMQMMMSNMMRMGMQLMVMTDDIISFTFPHSFFSSFFFLFPLTVSFSVVSERVVMTRVDDGQITTQVRMCVEGAVQEFVLLFLSIPSLLLSLFFPLFSLS